MQVIAHKYHCVGCGRPIAWDGKGTLCYTCFCGATLFADENHKFALPCSLVIGVVEGRELPHTDYYLGKSNYVSAEKQKAYEDLTKLGCIWSWECKKCKDKFLQRTRLQVKEGFIRFELHPELKTLIIGG